MEISSGPKRSCVEASPDGTITDDCRDESRAAKRQKTELASPFPLPNPTHSLLSPPLTSSRTMTPTAAAASQNLSPESKNNENRDPNSNNIQPHPPAGNKDGSRTANSAAKASFSSSSIYGQKSVLLPSGGLNQMRNMVRTMTGGLVTMDGNFGTGAKARKKRKNLKRREKKREKERLERLAASATGTEATTPTTTTTGSSSVDHVAGQKPHSKEELSTSDLGKRNEVENVPDSGSSKHDAEQEQDPEDQEDQEDQDSDKEVANYTVRALTYLLSVKAEADKLPPFWTSTGGQGKNISSQSQSSSQPSSKNQEQKVAAGTIARYDDGVYISYSADAVGRPNWGERDAGVEDGDSKYGNEGTEWDGGDDDDDGEYWDDEEEEWEDDGEDEGDPEADDGRSRPVVKTLDISTMTPADAFYHTLSEQFFSLRDKISSLSQTPRPESEVTSIVTTWLLQQRSRPSAYPSSSFSSSSLGPPTVLLRVRPGTFSLWKRTLLTTFPHPLQVATLSSPQTVIAVLRMVTQLMKRGSPVPKSLGAWIWSLLARLPDVGVMVNDQVAIVRDVGKRAAWLVVGLKEAEEREGKGPGGEEEGGEEEDECEDEDGEGEREEELGDGQEDGASPSGELGCLNADSGEPVEAGEPGAENQGRSDDPNCEDEDELALSRAKEMLINQVLNQTISQSGVHTSTSASTFTSPLSTSTSAPNPKNDGPSTSADQVEIQAGSEHQPQHDGHGNFTSERISEDTSEVEKQDHKAGTGDDITDPSVTTNITNSSSTTLGTSAKAASVSTRENAKDKDAEAEGGDGGDGKEDEEEEEEQDEKMSTIATLDSILHVIGTVFGQRDLLDFRYMA